ncbi:MAG: hypothetical protein K9N35_05660 [Candidatus Marinimicrobia bacterium]|nr:hypothetical protein [Candidatus Neomarinimicrobiota bacterium]
MAEERDRLIWNKNCLLNTRHDQPYRADGHLLSLNLIWENNPELRDECKEDWLEIIEWCKDDPLCHDAIYFLKEFETWRDYYE